jgi:hypothetical protein
MARIVILSRKSIRAPFFKTRLFTLQERCLLALVPGLVTEEYDVLWVLWRSAIHAMKEKARSTFLSTTSCVPGTPTNGNDELPMCVT